MTYTVRPYRGNHPKWRYTILRPDGTVHSHTRDLDLALYTAAHLITLAQGAA